MARVVRPRQASTGAISAARSNICQVPAGAGPSTLRWQVQTSTQTVVHRAWHPASSPLLGQRPKGRSAQKCPQTECSHLLRLWRRCLGAAHAWVPGQAADLCLGVTSTFASWAARWCSSGRAARAWAWCWLWGVPFTKLCRSAARLGDPLRRVWCLPAAPPGCEPQALGHPGKRQPGTRFTGASPTWRRHQARACPSTGI